MIVRGIGAMTFLHCWQRRVRYGRRVAVVLALVLEVSISAAGATGARAADRDAAPTHGTTPAVTSRVAAPTLAGRVVTFSLSGIEPDFDPIDRVIIAARLHDPHPVASALPDMTLVLSTYLENFQPKTTPLLPDVLRPDRTATALGGFIQGKAALVDGAGRVRYRGSILAEVFLDNTVHAIVDLDPQGLPTAAPLRLMGVFTLHQDLTLAGALRPTRAIAPAEAAALRVAHPGPVSWQAVVAGMRVRFPQMVGTGGGAPSGALAQSRPATTVALARGPLARPRRQSGPASARTRPSPTPAQAAPTVAIVTLFMALSVAATWRARRGKRRSGAATAT